MKVKTVRDVPIDKDLVLIGGGHAHVHVIRSFGMKPIPGVRLTVVSRDIDTPYSGMLPGYVAGFYSREECHIDLRPLARFAQARLIQDDVVGLDRDGCRLLFKSRPEIAYDVVSIDIGSTPKIDALAGAALHGTSVKPISQFAARWQAVMARVTASKAPMSLVVVGGGAAGVEVLLAARHRLRTLRADGGGNPDDLTFTLITRGDLLAGQNARTQHAFRGIMRDQGVRLVDGCTVASVDDRIVRAADGREFAYDELLWVTEAGAAAWLRETGLALDDRGFIAINECLRSVNTANVFAAGDCATSVVDPRPKAGVFAVRQGPPLAENLRRALRGDTLRPFKPQKQFLAIISAGDRYAVATRGPFAVEGRRVWDWKDHIDRKWMANAKRIPELAAMQGGAAPRDGSDAMRCGGCGAKVGPDVLSRVMERLQPKPSGLAVVGLDRLDDAAIVAPPPGMLLVQTVDFFRSFIDDPYVFGRIAATHALGDIYAMGGQPLTALATAVVPYARPSKVEEDLYQILRGGLDVLEAEGCSLVGGHSAEGAELALGFAVNGAVEPGKVLRKGGAQSGDVLILTKPLGTGALLAAEMRGKAKADWIATALRSMQQSSRETSAILRDCGARAATDVTGFGLAGHLLEMLYASGVAAEIDLDAIPLLAGVREVLDMGIVSSLAPQNERAGASIAGMERLANDRTAGILFDPQTAGGLLAAVPAERAPACVEKLNSTQCCSAAVIGNMIPAAEGSARLMLRRGSAA